MQWTVIEKQQQKQSKVLSENLRMKKKIPIWFWDVQRKSEYTFSSSYMIVRDRF